MPNETPKSPLRTSIEELIRLLSPDERARLRVWIEAKFDVRGDDKPKVF